MNEVVTMILVFLAGCILGVLFFGGLWLTVKKAVNAKMPAVLILSSFFLRISIIMIGFYVVGADNWQHLLGCLLGFIAARFAVLYFTKTFDAKQMNLTKEERHGIKS
jgi:F1F0 ATPase subunit 2